MPITIMPEINTDKLPYFALYKEYTVYSTMIIKPQNPAMELSITDICILMALQSNCILNTKEKRKHSTSPLLEGCQLPYSYYKEKFGFSNTTVRRSLDKLEQLKLIQVNKENQASNHTNTPVVHLLKDFSNASTSPISAQAYGDITSSYSDKSRFVKIFFNTFKPEYWNGRDLTCTDILLYNILYSFNYNNTHNTTHEFKGSINDIGCWLPISNDTITKSLKNLKRFELIDRDIILDKKAIGGKSNLITLRTNIITEIPEEYFVW